MGELALTIAGSRTVYSADELIEKQIPLVQTVIRTALKQFGMQNDNEEEGRAAEGDHQDQLASEGQSKKCMQRDTQNAVEFAASSQETAEPGEKIDRRWVGGTLKTTLQVASGR